jgi:hypothetical protein
MRRFYKNPGPGQFRGEGEWVEAKTPQEIKFWEHCRDTEWLPVKTEDDEDAP